MGRKLFNQIAAAGSEEPLVGSSLEPASSTGRTRPVQRLADGLLDMSANSIRLIPLAQIEASAAKDRLEVSDGVEKLAESILLHGQQVPILVRPLPHAPDRFQVVYGRRRLAAIRSLGGNRTVKAIVRTLKDEEAVVAQGQENNQRLDPSHIEKSLFAKELREAGYDTQVIVDALGVDRYTVSRMIGVVERIPFAVIELIGAAHDVGRRPWKNLSDILALRRFDPIPVIEKAIASRPDATSSKRFQIAFEAAKMEDARILEERRLSHGSTRPEANQALTSPSMEIRAGKDSVSITVRTEHPEAFHAWLAKNSNNLLEELWSRFERSEAVHEDCPHDQNSGRG